MVVEMCRACLTTGKGMVQMDETFLDSYNLLTSLNIKFTEDTPIYCCTTCFDGANFCIEFREKCIASDKTLNEILFPDCKEKQSSTDENEVERTVLKEEIKLEYEDYSHYDYLDDGNNYEDAEYLEITTNEVEEAKPLTLSKRKTKKLMANCELKIKNKKVTESELKIEKEKLVTDCELHCVICPQNFKDHITLTKHLDNHNLDILCIQCKEHFISLPHLLGHRIEHMPEKLRRCHICSKKFLTAPSLEYHYMKIHELAEKDALIQCKKCSSFYRSGRKLQRHIAEAHSTKYICKHCSIRFPNKYQLKIHMHKHEKAKIYECDLCDYTTKYTSGVRAHKLRKHTEGTLYCKTCPGAFSSQVHLDRHVCKYANGNICPVCGINIKTKCGNAFARHMLMHGTDHPYKCDKCPSEFKSRSSYATHMDKHAGTPKHKCEFCQRSFYARTVLIKHRRTHTGEKPYVCTICSKGFTGNHNLKVHMRVHGIMNLIIKKDH